MSKTPRAFIFILVSLLCLFFAQTAMAKTHYVSQAGAGEDCKLLAPCSLETAFDNAVSNDAIMIESGSYTTARNLRDTGRTLHIVGNRNERPAPEINFTTSYNQWSLELTGNGSSVSNLKFVSPNLDGLYLGPNTSADRMEIRSYLTACYVLSRLTNSLCHSSDYTGLDLGWNQTGKLIQNVTAAGNMFGIVINGGEASIYNSIIKGNGTALETNFYGGHNAQTTVGNTIIDGSIHGTWIDGGNVTTQDPGFVSPTDFKLASGSPALQGGDINQTWGHQALDNTWRFAGGSPDIGAYQVADVNKEYWTSNGGAGDCTENSPCDLSNLVQAINTNSKDANGVTIHVAPGTYDPMNRPFSDHQGPLNIVGSPGVNKPLLIPSFSGGYQLQGNSHMQDIAFEMDSMFSNSYLAHKSIAERVLVTGPDSICSLSDSARMVSSICANKYNQNMNAIGANNVSFMEGTSSTTDAGVVIYAQSSILDLNGSMLYKPDWPVPFDIDNHGSTINGDYQSTDNPNKFVNVGANDFTPSKDSEFIDTAPGATSVSAWRDFNYNVRDWGFGRDYGAVEAQYAFTEKVDETPLVASSNISGLIGDRYGDTYTVTATTNGQSDVEDTFTTVANLASYQDFEANLTGLVPSTDYDYTITADSNDLVVSTGSFTTGDLQVPVITSSPASVATNPNATFEFTFTNSDVSHMCVIDNNAPFACVSPYIANGLSDGAHTFEVYEAAGGTSSPHAVASFTIDTTAPNTLVITGAPVGNTTTDQATLTWSADQNATSECNINSLGWIPCTSPLVLSGLTVGNHNVQVRQIDAVGNISAPTSVSWVQVLVNTGGNDNAGETHTDNNPPSQTNNDSNAKPSLDVRLNTTIITTGQYVSVICHIPSGGLKSCNGDLTALIGGKKVKVGTGVQTTSKAEGVYLLRVDVKLTKYFTNYLKARPKMMPVNMQVQATLVDQTKLSKDATTSIGNSVVKKSSYSFRSESTKLTPAQKTWLNALAAQVGTAKKIRCEGNTDSRGTVSYNKKLGLKRAKAVCNYLKTRGVSVSYQSISYGEARPVATNKTAKGRAMNRRVNIVVIR